jgi:hypothetical protein
VEGEEREELARGNERDTQGKRVKGRQRGREREGGRGEREVRGGREWREKGLFSYPGWTVCVCWMREIEGKREGERERMNDRKTSEREG